MMSTRNLAQVIAEIAGALIAQAVRQALDELTELHAATLREFRNQIAQATRPRRAGATIATDCAGALAAVRREIDPRGAHLAHDCAGAVREVESEIEQQRVQIHIRRANSKTR